MAKQEEIGDAVDTGKAVTGINSATGQEAARRAGKEEIPEGEDRGSVVEIDGEPVADYAGNDVQKPEGNQAEPALFVANGTIPPNMVPSNSGLVPVSASAASPEDAEKRLEEHQATVDAEREAAFGIRKEISEDQIAKMSAPELRAVASDRGYDISNAAGTRGTRAAFRTAQSEDKSFRKSKKSKRK